MPNATRDVSISSDLNTYTASLDCSSYHDDKLYVDVSNGVSRTLSQGYYLNVSNDQQKTGSITLYPYFFSKQGASKTFSNIYSPQLKNSRPVLVYMPPSWVENGLRPSYPVLVVHDGQYMFNDSTAGKDGSWRLGQAIEQQLLQGSIDEMMVVAVDCNDNRTAELTYSVEPLDPVSGGPRGNLYLDFIRDTILPFVSTQFPASSAVTERGILGASLGGLISCYAGWTRPEEYSRAGCMSSSFWWNSEDFNSQVLVQNKPPPYRTKFYLDSGDTGMLLDDLEQTIRVREHMLKLGWSLDQNLFYLRDHGGGHSTPFWRNRVWLALRKLYPKPLLNPALPLY